MAVLDLGLRYKTQPPNPVPIDRSGTGKKLRFALLGNCPIELANGIDRSGTLGTSSATPNGIAYAPAGTATTWVRQLADLDPAISGSFSVNWYGYIQTNVQEVLLDSLGGGVGWYFYLEASAPGQSRLILYSAGAASVAEVTIVVPDNSLHSLSVVYNSTAATAEFFMDGASIGSGAWTRDTTAMTAQTFGMYSASPQKMLTVQAYAGMLAAAEMAAA